VDFCIFPWFVDGGVGLAEGEKTVKVSVDVWERLMKLKIEMRARSLDEVIRELFRRADAG
jgi:molybdopterin biosynthesis enzyme MoaB